MEDGSMLNKLMEKKWTVPYKTGIYLKWISKGGEVYEDFRKIGMNEIDAPCKIFYQVIC